MNGEARRTFATVYQAELLFNARRSVPYVLGLLFSANAVFWWIGGPAMSRGWATNSDFYIVRLFVGFMFMTAPLFVGLLMGDPVLRDYEVRMDPLLFSKPFRRSGYLLGKFFGNFSVLICCQACFAVTLVLLQSVAIQRMTVLPFRVLPYAQHFVVLIVLSTLPLAAMCFALSTLTRSAKAAYALMASFYVVYLTYQLSIRNLPLQWRIVLDPLLFHINAGIDQQGNARLLNELSIGYDSGVIANRLLVIVASALCLAVVCVFFSTVPSPTMTPKWVSAPTRRGPARGGRRGEFAQRVSTAIVNGVSPAPWRSHPLLASLEIELRLLAAEKGVAFVIPLIVLAGIASIAYYGVPASISPSAAYAGRSAEGLQLLLCVSVLFFTVEAIHRDRAVKFEALLWSTPLANASIILPKFAATVLVSFILSALVAALTIGLQILRGDAPLDGIEYATTYTLVLVPGVVFVSAASALLAVWFREKHVAYAVAFGTGGALYYLYARGHADWWMNPLMYERWRPEVFAGPVLSMAGMIPERIFWLAAAGVLLVVASRQMLRADRHRPGR